MGTVCDILIIGAGPGGGSAALHAARSGLCVMLVEDHSEIGTPVHCGECLSLLATQNLGLEIPEEVISLDCKGIRVIFPDGSKKMLSEPGFVLEKHLFERWIINQAVDAGATLSLSHRVKSMKRIYNSNNEFSNWIIDGDGNDFPIETKIVIDASGVAGVASKLLNMNQDVEVIAGFQYEMHEVPNDGYLDFYLWPKYSPYGYVWMIPKNAGRANVGLVTTDKQGSIQYLESFIEDTYLKENPKVDPPWRRKGIKVRPFGGTIPISGPREKTYADGLLIVGDAAGFTSPLFEGGSHLALKSGKYAAEVATKAIEKANFSASGLSVYQSLWHSEFPPYQKILKGKTALYKLTDEELSFMGRCLPNEMSKMNVITKLGVGLKILFFCPKLLFKGAVSVLLSFGYSRAKYYGW